MKASVSSSGKTTQQPSLKKNPLIHALRLFKVLYLKLFRINDTPQKIAIGVGVGVFFGVVPGMGPFAALTLAFILKINKAAALLGSILTNTWLSIPTFLVSVKIGSLVTGSQYAEVSRAWAALMRDFRWSTLAETSLGTIVIPVVAGYSIVGLIVGAVAYAATLTILKIAKRPGRGA